jgi:hypothetical protein
MEKSPDELREQFGHWGDHPTLSVSEWKKEVHSDNTRLGYWEWVASILQFEEESEQISTAQDSN